MNAITLLDEMIKRLEADEAAHPGSDMTRAQQIVCEVVRDAAIVDRTAAESRLAARVLGHGIHSRDYICDACGTPSTSVRCADCVDALRMDGEDMMEVAS